jgi:signal peptidase
MHRRKLRRRLGATVAWLVIGAVSAVLVAAVLLPRAVGGTPYVILTGSMRPSMPPGTLVVTRPVDAANLGVGAVITYQLASGRSEVVTHRIVAQGVNAVGERVFHTQGDANTAVDTGWVRPVQIRGARWYSVPYLGYVTTRIGNHQREAIQALIIAGLLAYAAAMLVGGLRERWQRPAVPR